MRAVCNFTANLLSGLLNHRFAKLLLFGGVLLMASGMSAQAQVTIYARFSNGTGVWAGELTTPRVGWTVLKSASFGSESPPTAQGVGIGPMAFKKLEIEKVVNTLTPQFLASMASGTSMGVTGTDLTLEFEKVTQAGAVVFFRVEFENVFFSSSAMSAATGDTELSEKVSLIYGSARYTSYPILANGTLGPAVIKSWNQVTASATFPNP